MEHSLIVLSLNLLISLLFLIYSSDRFVHGSIILANHFKISPIFVGLTIVAFGTSAPEIFISIFSAVNDAADIGIGNAIGSNIVNICVVLGATALIDVVHVRHGLLVREIPIFFLINFIAVFMLLSKNYFGVIEGYILLALYFISFAWLMWKNLHSKEASKEAIEHIDTHEHKISSGVFWLLFGFIIMPLSSHFLVDNSSAIAKLLGVSELIIGLTIVSIGTSLPELATSMISIAKGHHDLAIGNVLGSNIANLTLVLGPIGILSPTVVPSDLSRDVFAMLAISIILIAMSFWKKHVLGKIDGIILLALYPTYLFLLAF